MRRGLQLALRRRRRQRCGLESESRGRSGTRAPRSRQRHQPPPRRAAGHHLFVRSTRQGRLPGPEPAARLHMRWPAGVGHGSRGSEGTLAPTLRSSALILSLCVSLGCHGFLLPCRLSSQAGGRPLSVSHSRCVMSRASSSCSLFTRAARSTGERPTHFQLRLFINLQVRAVRSSASQNQRIRNRRGGTAPRRAPIFFHAIGRKQNKKSLVARARGTV